MGWRFQLLTFYIPFAQPFYFERSQVFVPSCSTTKVLSDLLILHDFAISSIASYCSSKQLINPLSDTVSIASGNGPKSAGKV